MDARSLKIFAGAFAIAFLALIGTWVAVDLLSNLDEFLAVDGPDAALGRVAFQHYSSVLRARGGSLLGPFAVASIVPAFVLARVAARRTGSMA